MGAQVDLPAVQPVLLQQEAHQPAQDPYDCRWRVVSLLGLPASRRASEQSCDWCEVVSRGHQPDVQKEPHLWHLSNHGSMASSMYLCVPLPRAWHVCSNRIAAQFKAYLRPELSCQVHMPGHAGSILHCWLCALWQLQKLLQDQGQGGVLQPASFIRFSHFPRPQRAMRMRCAMVKPDFVRSDSRASCGVTDMLSLSSCICTQRLTLMGLGLKPQRCRASHLWQGSKERSGQRAPSGCGCSGHSLRADMRQVAGRAAPLQPGWAQQAKRSCCQDPVVASAGLQLSAPQHLHPAQKRRCLI